MDTKYQMLVIPLSHNKEYGTNMQQCSNFIKLSQSTLSFSLTDTSMRLDKLPAFQQQVRQFIPLSIPIIRPHFQVRSQEISLVMETAISPKLMIRIPVQ